MELIYIIAASIGFALMIYLIVALLKPEMFQ